MAISIETRQKFRQILQSVEKADEIIDNLDQATGYSTNYQQNFTISDWQNSEAGDTYSILITHNLNTLYPIVRLLETGVEVKLVEPHKMKIIDNNSIQIYVTQTSSDARFNGRISIDR